MNVAGASVDSAVGSGVVVGMLVAVGSGGKVGLGGGVTVGSVTLMTGGGSVTGTAVSSTNGFDGGSCTIAICIDVGAIVGGDSAAIEPSSQPTVASNIRHASNPAQRTNTDLFTSGRLYCERFEGRPFSLFVNGMMHRLPPCDTI